MSSFFSFIFWGTLSLSEKEDLIGVALVVIGVLGELFLEIASIWLPYNPTNFPPLETILGLKKKHLEVIFVSLVAIGVGIELYALPISLNESHIKIAELENKTEALRKQNNKLELIIKPRSFSEGQIQAGAFLLKKHAGTKVDISARSEDWESIDFARPLRGILSSAGWSVPGDVSLELMMGRSSPEGVSISTNQMSNTEAAIALNKFLNDCGFQCELVAPRSRRMVPDPGAFLITIGQKPQGMPSRQ
jgi:hypothetical protein